MGFPRAPNQEANTGWELVLLLALSILLPRGSRQITFFLGLGFLSDNGEQNEQKM